MVKPRQLLNSGRNSSSSSIAVVWLLQHIQLFKTPWTVACQAPLSMGLSQQKYWSGLPFPSPGNLPDSGIERTSPALADGFFTSEPTGEPSLAYAKD